jgi:hypothetical protein
LATNVGFIAIKQVYQAFFRQFFQFCQFYLMKYLVSGACGRFCGCTNYFYIF